MTERHLFERIRPLFPAKDDIRILTEISIKNKNCNLKFHIAKCVELRKNAAVYEWLGEGIREVVPFELAESYGSSDVDSAIMSALNNFIRDKFLNTTQSLDDYYQNLQMVVVLARQALKEADKIKSRIMESLHKTEIWDPSK